MRRAAALCLLVLPSIWLPWNASAQVVDARDTGNTIGAGVLWVEQPYRGLDHTIYAFPTITWNAGRFFVRETGLGYQLVNKGPWSFDAFAELRFDGYDADDSDYLEGMEDRDGSIDGGLAVVRRSEQFGKFALSAGGDLLNRHGGYEIDLTWSILTRFGIPSARLRYESSSLVDYYYGVEDDEATAARPAYDPGSALVFSANYTIGLPLSEGWASVANIGVDLFPSEITDSPIVDRDTRWHLFVGVSYVFK